MQKEKTNYKVQKVRMPPRMHCFYFLAVERLVLVILVALRLIFFGVFAFLGLLAGAGFLGFFGLFAFFFLGDFLGVAPVVPVAVFLAFLTFLTEVFFFPTFFFRGVGGFLFNLKEPEAPLPLVRTRDFLATRRLMATRILAFFLSTSKPPAFSAFFNAARDMPPRSLDAATAFSIRLEMEDPEGPFLDPTLRLGDLAGVAKGVAAAVEDIVVLLRQSVISAVLMLKVLMKPQ